MNEPKKKNHAKTVLYIVIFTILYGIISFTVRKVTSPASEAGSMMQVNEQMAREIETAKSEATKDKSASEILREKSTQKMNETLDSASSPKKKKSEAAAIFLGAYFLNTQARPAYCQSLGVSIDSFTTAYRKRHADLLPIAKASIEERLRESGSHHDMDDYARSISPSLNQAVSLDMKDLSFKWKMTEKEACGVLEAKAYEIVDLMDLRKAMPKVTGILAEG